jgi:hypothetical protein
MTRLYSLLAIAVLLPLLLVPTGSTQARSPIFDQPKQDNSETIVVPVGTKIVVDIFEENPPRNVSRLQTGKVVNIVQVGSTVVIPAMSKVTIQHSGGMMELTEVTIDGVRYKLQTDRLTLEEGSTSEATFTLRKTVTIKR